jgi:hypothetical protein
MWQTTKSAPAIHPSIDSLAEMITAKAKGTTAEVAELREMCRRKMRSYREDVFLKRFVPGPEQDAARTRWNLVSTFANR